MIEWESGESTNEPTPPEHENDDWRTHDETEETCGEYVQEAWG